MKKCLAMALLCASASALMAQESFVNRLSVGGSLVVTQGDFRTFTHKNMGFGVEATCDITRNDQPINMRGFVGYLSVKGAKRDDLAATFDLSGTRVGLDFVFKTPMAALRPYAGLTLTRWSGSVDGNPDDYQFYDRQVDFSDHKPKFGFRVGVDYYLTPHLVLAMDYNLSEWRHNTQFSYSTTNPKPLPGLNPVNPSWVTLTGRYHF